MDVTDTPSDLSIILPALNEARSLEILLPETTEEAARSTAATTGNSESSSSVNDSGENCSNQAS